MKGWSLAFVQSWRARSKPTEHRHPAWRTFVSPNWSQSSSNKLSSPPANQKRSKGKGSRLSFFLFKLVPFWNIGNRWDAANRFVLCTTGQNEKLLSYTAVWVENSPWNYFPPTCHFFRNLQSHTSNIRCPETFEIILFKEKKKKKLNGNSGSLFLADNMQLRLLKVAGAAAATGVSIPGWWCRFGSRHLPFSRPSPSICLTIESGTASVLVASLKLPVYVLLFLAEGVRGQGVPFK